MSACNHIYGFTESADGSTVVLTLMPNDPAPGAVREDFRFCPRCGIQMRLTTEQLQAVVASMRENQVRPRIIKTETQALNANRADRLLGLPGNWKVGDEYYLYSNGRFIGDKQ